MGLTNLTLVNPSRYPSAEATERASKAADILAEAEVHNNIADAISDCRLIIGASVRTRTLPSRLVTPRELAEKVKNHPENMPVAIMFGTENSGLTNDELHLCHYQVYIPTNPDYSSLNLAQAVQLISYELRLALTDVKQLPDQRVIANEMQVSRGQLEGLLQHFENTMLKSGYLNSDHRKQIDNRMSRFLSKAEVTQSEYKLLRGFLSSVDSALAE